MKIGDKVRRKGVMGEATIVSCEVNKHWDDIKQKQIIKTTYTARYENGFLITFYGFNIGRTIFKSDGEQISIFDYIKEKGD